MPNTLPTTPTTRGSLLILLVGLYLFFSIEDSRKLARPEWWFSTVGLTIMGSIMAFIVIGFVITVVLHLLGIIDISPPPPDYDYEYWP